MRLRSSNDLSRLLSWTSRHASRWQSQNTRRHAAVYLDLAEECLELCTGENACNRPIPATVCMQVHKYLQIALGETRLQRILTDMCIPPLLCSIRVNRQKCSTSQVLEALCAHPDITQHATGSPHVHSALGNVVCVPGQSRKLLDFDRPGTARTVTALDSLDLSRERRARACVHMHCHTPPGTLSTQPLHCK